MRRKIAFRVPLVVWVVIAIVTFPMLLESGLWRNATYAQQVSKPVNREIKLTVESQEDSPLLISAANFVSTNPYTTSYSFLVTNTGKKSIRAYTLRNVTTFGDQGESVVGSSLNHLVSRDLLVHQGQSRQKIQPDTDRYPGVVREVVLSVDFVEFDDGTVWGKDAFHSADVLAGQRAGGKAAIRYFLELVAKNEFRSSEIEERSLNVYAKVDSGASASWKRGYEIGIGIVRNRVAKAAALGNENLRRELESPFDASEGRLKL